ncbi:hypothetical protein EYF80_026031 [Liparis tanakae]|uniref:Uncharacterized protein n=1 Tax=Liparis tanakae TaxID=230148 RepID=A0A4Z2HFL9_9TELE|nr:hypothetical protein EYF80_026031 [Liparis tanakae]
MHNAARGELTVFGEHPELIRVDHPAGDLQLDSFRFQPLQPGQQSPALRETHGNTSAVTSHLQFLLQFSSVMPSSSSPQMSTAEKMSTTSTAQQHTKAKITMHFC